MKKLSTTHYVQTAVSGRCLVEEPAGKGPFRLLVGFHGYGQVAEDELVLLDRMTGSRDWLCCAVEALHPFYSRNGTVGACWMTDRDRERMIEENVRYVDAVIADLQGSYSLEGTLVYHGFSQGTAMASRAALLGSHEASAVMLIGGDIPPEHSRLERMSRVHIARGTRDRIYTDKLFERDISRLAQKGVAAVQFSFPGSHEADEAYLGAAGTFLSDLAGGRS